MKIAQIQMPVFVNKRETADYIKLKIADAAENADFIALPEMFCCPYHVDNFPIYAEKEGGEMWKLCSDLAAKYKIYLSAGTMPEIDDNGKVYNLSLIHI